MYAQHLEFLGDVGWNVKGAERTPFLKAPSWQFDMDSQIGQARSDAGAGTQGTRSSSLSWGAAGTSAAVDVSAASSGMEGDDSTS